MNLTNFVLQNLVRLRRFSLSRHRTIFTPSSLGVDKFHVIKDNAGKEFKNSKTPFMEKMTEMCADKTKNYAIFTEDLKNMMHLCENNEDEFNLLLEMAKKYNIAEGNNRLSNFVFGPQLMRLYHLLNVPEKAKEAFDSVEMKGFFNQVTSYVIYMSLMYNTAHYQDVIDAMKKMIDDRLSMIIMPRANLILTLASCYKMNSESSFETALNFIQKAEDVGSKLDAKILNFVSALALRQNKPHVAIELMSKSTSVSYGLKNIKIEALTQLGRAEDCIPILRSNIEHHKSNDSQEQNYGYLLSTISSLENALNDGNNKESLLEFSTTKKLLEEQSLIIDMTLEELLCQPIDFHTANGKGFSKLTARDKQRAMIASSFARQYLNKKDNRRYNRKSFSQL